MQNLVKIRHHMKSIINNVLIFYLYFYSVKAFYIKVIEIYKFMILKKSVNFFILC